MAHPPTTAQQSALDAALRDGSVSAWQALSDACAGDARLADWLADAAVGARQAGSPHVEKLLAAALTLDPWHLEATLRITRGYLARGLARQALKLLGDLRRHRLAHALPASSLDAPLLAAAQAAQDTETARAAAYRLAIAPDAAWSDLLDAAAYFRAEGDLDAQRTLCARLLKERPADAHAHLLTAQWLFDEGYNDDALKHLARARELGDTALGALADRLAFEIEHPEDSAAFKRLTQSFFVTSPDEAVPQLLELTGRHPRLAEAWLFLGFAQRRARRLNEARRAFERALELGEDPNAHKELGALLGELGEPRAALDHSLRALELLGEHDKILWLNVAAASLDLGQRAQAAQALGRARELDPNSPDVARLQAELESPRRGKSGFFNVKLWA